MSWDLMSEFDAGWLIGLVEGEGSFGVQKMTPDHRYKRTDNYFTPIFQISMTDLDVVERAHRLVGLGKLKTYTMRKGNKPLHGFRFSGRSACEFALWCYPHLGERRQNQIKKAFEMSTLQGAETYREALTTRV